MKSKYAAILNRLSEMRAAPYYAMARGDLATAEQTIVLLENQCAEWERIKVEANASGQGWMDRATELAEALRLFLNNAAKTKNYSGAYYISDAAIADLNAALAKCSDSALVEAK